MFSTGQPWGRRHMSSKWFCSRRILISALPRLLMGCVAFILATNADRAFAQLPTATILGTVRDSSGAVIPGADVAVRNTETGQSRMALSAEDGSYRFSALPVGNYE